MIFAKPVTEISTPDLQELLTDKAVENLRLEFKREIATNDERLKKLAAFANTIGGLVVIGAEGGGRRGGGHEQGAAVCGPGRDRVLR